MCRIGWSSIFLCVRKWVCRQVCRPRSGQSSAFVWSGREKISKYYFHWWNWCYREEKRSRTFYKWIKIDYIKSITCQNGWILNNEQSNCYGCYKQKRYFRPCFAPARKIRSCHLSFPTQLRITTVNSQSPPSKSDF